MDQRATRDARKVDVTEKAKKCNTFGRKSLYSALMGSRCQFDGFRMCSPEKKYIGLHKAAPNEILFGYQRVNTSGS